jgi:hypothetical protein
MLKLYWSKILLCDEVLRKLLSDWNIEIIRSFNGTGEVGGSRQQQGVTSQASPAGRYATSWIFIERLIEKPVLILIRNFVMYVWC